MHTIYVLCLMVDTGILTLINGDWAVGPYMLPLNIILVGSPLRKERIFLHIQLKCTSHAPEGSRENIYKADKTVAKYEQCML